MFKLLQKESAAHHVSDEHDNESHDEFKQRYNLLRNEYKPWQRNEIPQNRGKLLRICWFQFAFTFQILA